MNLLVVIPAVLMLCIIAWQDFSRRQILWIWLPLLFLLFAVNSFLSNGIKYFFLFFIVNTSYLVFVFTTTLLYISLRRKIPFKNVIGTYIGWGDLLFLAALTPFFSLFNFFVFCSVSLLVVLLAYLLYRILNKNASIKYPTAGIIALALAFCIILKQFTHADFYDDTLISGFLAMK